MPRLCVACLCAVLLVPVRAGTGENIEAAYHAAVVAYRGGRAEAAIDTVKRLDRGDLKSLLAVLKVKRAERSTWDRPLLMAAAMIHVDIALGAYRQNLIGDFDFHSQYAAALFAAADEPPPGSNEPRGTAGRRSALAIGSLILGDGHVEPAYTHLTRAVERFPDDAPLLIALGTTIETSASERSVNGFVSFNPFNRARAERNIDLKEAAKFYERAMSADATSAEARVRRAHVYILERDDAHAATLLEQALAREPPPAWTYLASLMLGGVRERAGDASAAAELYSAALQARPEGQSAFVALSALMHRTGNREAAAAAIDRLFARRLTVDSDDPWWNYRFGRWQEAEPELVALRAEARR